MKQRLIAALVIGGLLCAAAAMAAPEQGKFYLVGMGTAPDLMTVRATKVIAKADMILLEEGSDLDAWQFLIGDKEVWFCPHISRVLYGADIEAITDPVVKKVAIQADKNRKNTVAAIQKAVGEGKIVAALEWGDPMVYGTT
jgi:precorrin-4/cobalt-precorrin-4 C11-methyltransferase